MLTHLELMKEIPYLCNRVRDPNARFAIGILARENPVGFLKALIALKSPRFTNIIFEDGTDPEELLAEIENNK